MTRRLGAPAATLVLTAALLLAGCTGARGGSADRLTVFAAASLGPVMTEVERAYESVVGDLDVVVSTGSSAALATQIREGAPADVFLSADLTNPQALVESGQATGAVVPFAGNRLTVIVPRGDPAGVDSPADLARPGVRIIAAGEAVPISRYATQLVDRLADLPGAPAGFADSYLANVVSREDDVAAVLSKIALGEGDAAIVYATDAARAEDIEEVPVPAEANVTATYGAVVVADPERDAAARAFLDWLAGADGRAVLDAAGFEPPP